MGYAIAKLTELGYNISIPVTDSQDYDLIADLDGNLLIANDRFEGIKIVNGKVTIPDRPGIGVLPIL